MPGYSPPAHLDTEPKGRSKKKNRGQDDPYHPGMEPLIAEESRLIDSRVTSFGYVLLAVSVIVLLCIISKFIIAYVFTGGDFFRYIFGSKNATDWSKCMDERSQRNQLPNGAAAEDDDRITPKDLVVSTGLHVTAGDSALSPKNMLQFMVMLPDAIRRTVEAYPQLVTIPKWWVLVLYFAPLLIGFFNFFSALAAVSVRSHTSVHGLRCFALFTSITFLVDVLLNSTLLLNIGVLIWMHFSENAAMKFMFLPPCESVRLAFIALDCFAMLLLIFSTMLVIALITFFCHSLCNSPDISESDDGFDGRNIWVV